MTILPKTTSDIALLVAGTPFKTAAGVYCEKTDLAGHNSVEIGSGHAFDIPNGTIVTVDVGGAYQTGNA